MQISRRGFFRMATAGAAVAACGAARAESAEGADGAVGMLVDTTRCVGCRGCEAACAEANGLPEPPGDECLSSRRETSEDAFTVVNRAEKAPGEPRYAKQQCLHCLAPACASACPVRAMTKLPSGPVVYDADKCMGCRYCMLACPFDVPKYEYRSPAPRVRKCTFCAGRQAEGKLPACAEACPSGALVFGKRSELLDEAKTRIYGTPGRYVRHVYGENEAGGTSWLYVTDVPPELLALKAGVPGKAFPELVSGALAAPPLVMTLWPPLLMGLYAITRRRTDAEGGAAAREEDHHG